MKNLFLLLFLQISLIATVISQGQPHILSSTTPLITDQNWKSMISPSGAWGQNSGPNGSNDMAWTQRTNPGPLYWPASQLVSIPTCLTPYLQVPIPGTNPIWPAARVGCSVSNQVALFRRNFSVSNSNRFCRYRLLVEVDNVAYIYINSQYVGACAGGWATNSPTVFDVSNFIANSNNSEDALSIQVYDDGTTGWLSAKLEVDSAVNCNNYQMFVNKLPGTSCQNGFTYEPLIGGTPQNASGDQQAICCNFRFSTDITSYDYYHKWQLYWVDANGGLVKLKEKISPPQPSYFDVSFPSGSMNPWADGEFVICVTPFNNNAGAPVISKLCKRFKYTSEDCVPRFLD